jgi:hypothetical protein
MKIIIILIIIKLITSTNLNNNIKIFNLEPVHSKTFPIYVNCKIYKFITIKISNKNITIFNKTDACKVKENEYENVFWINSGINKEEYTLEYWETNNTNVIYEKHNFTQNFIEYKPEKVISIIINFFTYTNSDPDGYTESFQIELVNKINLNVKRVIKGTH